MDKHEKNKILTRTRRRFEESNITMPPEQKNRSWIVGKERIEKKMTTSATNELGKHPSKKVITELLEKPNNETNKLVVGLWRTSQNYEVKFRH